MPNQEPTRTLSYICPRCRQSVIVEKSLFALAAAPVKVPCPCGGSALEVELLPDKARLRVPCMYCGKEHAVSCAASAFVGQEALVFSCATSGMDCCYVGQEGAVYAATARLEQTVDRLEQAGEQEQAFLNEVVMQEVLSELKDIAQRDGISCACGSKGWTFRVNYSTVDLICTGCGAQMRLGAATADDIDSICCKHTLRIGGRKE